MRIIAGRLRGRRLDAPPGYKTRPITDRLKETLFNMLGARLDVPGSLPPIAVLDVFAGTGGLGLEALSRGAASCTFVERERRALTALRQNLRTLEVGPAGAILAENAWTFRLLAPAGGYGLVFFDPPFPDAQNVLRVLGFLERLAPSISPDGLIVFRFENGTCYDWTALRGLKCVEERTIGRNVLALLAPLPPNDTREPPPSTEGAEGASDQ